MDAALGSTRVANATPAGSLAFAQGSTGWARELLLAFALAFGGLVLLRTRS
jgi:Ca-activated chloride channel family protein